MFRKEDVRGDFCPVDNSGEVLEQGGACPSPPDTLAVPPQESVTSGGAGNETLAPRVNPSCLNPDTALESVLDFFAPRPGVGDAPPGSSIKVGEAEPACYVQRTANLDAELRTIPLYPPSKCKLKYAVIGCNCNRRIVPSVCMSLDCAPCAPYVGARRAFSVLKRIIGISLFQQKTYSKKPLIYTIFTIPKAIRNRYLDKAEWQKVRKRAWTLLKEYFGALYGVEVTHPAGDKDKSIFHPHLNFLWVQKSGFRPFIDVNLLREKWSAVLKVDISDVYSQYTSKISKLSHWTKYVTRTFPGTHKWTGSLRWYGKYPKEKLNVEYLCNDCGCSYRLIGYVSADDVHNWYKYGQLMGIDPPWERDECITHIKRKRSTHAVITP